MKRVQQASLLFCLLLIPCIGLAEQDTKTPQTVTGAFVEITGLTMDTTSYETFDNVKVSESSSNHPVPLSLSFMASSGDIIFRPEFGLPQTANGISITAILGIGYLIADMVEVGFSLGGGSASESRSSPDQFGTKAQEVSDRSFGLYGRFHKTFDDSLSMEAGTGIGVGFYNYLDDSVDGKTERDAVSFTAGINIKGVYHLSEIVDFVISGAFNFRREPLRNEDANGSSDDAIAYYTYAFSPLGLRLKF